MRKLQQFFVAKFPSGRLEKDNFDIKRNISELRLKKELVSLADSQVLRTIRYIRYKNNNEGLQYSSELLKHLQGEKKRILKSKNKEEKQKISKIIKDINEILYIPEYILITVENLSDYRKMIRTGLNINGKKYVRLLCGAGMARNNTVAFVLEDIEVELKTMLKNGMDENILITENKYNAYFALSSTATHTVSTPKFLLISDCEIKMTKPVDFVTETFTDNPLHNKEKIESVFTELDFNLFDGGGLISIQKATEWAKELELDYVPSVFIIRNIFVKGCLFTVDFKKFAKEVAKKDKVIDLYGDEIDINETDIILTKSQHKLHNAYSSAKQYQDFCDLNLNFWGISRVSPKNDDNFFLTNYQFCQVLDLKDDDVKELCTPTVNWLTKVSGLDRNYSLLFLLGNLCDKTEIDPKDLFNITSDNLTKALIANKEMINDEYIRQTLVYSINKKIQESYIGKLIVKGCFNTMIPDLYALMEHSFGLEVKGLLKEFEHYAQYWNDRGSKSAVGMRSPLTWRSEVNKLNFIQNEKTEEWFQYINSGVIYNVWGSDCMIAAD